MFRRLITAAAVATALFAGHAKSQTVDPSATDLALQVAASITGAVDTAAAGADLGGTPLENAAVATMIGQARAYDHLAHNIVQDLSTVSTMSADERASLSSALKIITAASAN